MSGNGATPTPDASKQKVPVFLLSAAPNGDIGWESQVPTVVLAHMLQRVLLKLYTEGQHQGSPLFVPDRRIVT